MPVPGTDPSLPKHLATLIAKGDIRLAQVPAFFLARSDQSGGKAAADWVAASRR